MTLINVMCLLMGAAGQVKGMKFSIKHEAKPLCSVLKYTSISHSPSRFMIEGLADCE